MMIDLYNQLVEANKAYRAGSPIMSDTAYDALTQKLSDLDPDHPYLKSIEPEKVDQGEAVPHVRPMLSTEKVYDLDVLQAWLGSYPEGTTFRVTPKLDGCAAQLEGNTLKTRGTGLRGTDITHLYSWGLVDETGGDGVGEIVLLSSFWDDRNLGKTFKHPRNVVVGAIGASYPEDHVADAYAAGAIRFLRFDNLPNFTGTSEAVLQQLQGDLWERLENSVDCVIDGLVIEVTDEAIKTEQGASSNHHRWMRAFKRKGDIASTTVHDVTWQVGRLGSITPVLEVEPVFLSGATISRITAHNVAYAEEHFIGVGAEVTFVRSGEVIPKHESTEQPGVVEVPTNCPSCGTELIRSGVSLNCPNTSLCEEQRTQMLRHWFKLLPADEFGPATLQALYRAGFKTVRSLYHARSLRVEGISPHMAEKLSEQLDRSMTVPVEDWMWLAAWGLPGLGRGTSKRILKHIPLEALLAGVSTVLLTEIPTVGEKTARQVVFGLDRVAADAQDLLPEFNLERTQIVDSWRHMYTPEQLDLLGPVVTFASDTVSPFTGKRILFTGTMSLGTRNEMKKKAELLGATVASSVSKKLDILVVGAKPGSKLAKAEKLGTVQILTETEWVELSES